MKKILFINICFLLGLLVNELGAQEHHQWLRKGNKDYKAGEYNAAEEGYRKSLEKKSTPRGAYNLGNAIYNQPERLEEAVTQYTEAAERSKDKEVKSKAYHNLGNAYFQQQNYEKSLEAYKNALRLNPKDVDTKNNLMLARQLQQVQQQQQQQQQENQDQENEEQSDQQQEQQQQQQDDQQQQQEQEQQPSPQPNDEEGEQEQEEQQAKELEEKDLNKEEARKLLQIMDEEERKVQEKMRKGSSKKTKSSKDW